MSKLFSLFRKVTDFINVQLWNIRLHKVDKRQGFFIRQLRIIILSVRGFNEDKCTLKASALTYYTLFSIVPVIALLFAIAKGFGFEKKLQEDLIQDFNEHSAVLNQVFQYANSLLDSTKGGVIAGVGVVLLLWSVMKLLDNIEDSLNEIWEIKKGRNWIRKFTDYTAILLIAPIFLIVSGSITVLLKNQADSAINSVSWLQHIGPLIQLLMKLLSWLLICMLFTFLYLVIPNTKVKFGSAFRAAIVSAIMFEVLEWAYITFQIGVANYNRIYGGFAALPLFLVWVQSSWFIVLFGAEMAFANQNVDHYELENEIQNLSIRYKRIISLLIANLVVKNFVEGKQALTAEEIAHKLDLPVRMARSILFEFVETGMFNEVKVADEKDFHYQPALSENTLSIKFIIDKLEGKGVNEMNLNLPQELNSIQGIMKEFDHLLENNKGNILVKDLD